MSVRRLLFLPLLAAVVAVPGTARADVPVGAVAHDTPLVADAGFAAWRGDDGRLVVRPAGGSPRVTSLRPPASARFDVGDARGGGLRRAQVVWTEGCSTRTRHCAVRSATVTTTSAGPARLIAHIPYRGGGSPAIAVEGAHLAYAVRSGSCDVPYYDGRRLDRGHCARLSQLDLGDGHVAALASPTATPRATEARVVRTRGGSSRTLQRESQGEESNFIGSVSIDRHTLFTARGGIRQANVFQRLSFGGTQRTALRSFVALEGAAARDRGRTYYLQSTGYESTGDCGCLVVAGDDPFSGATRTLVPEVSLTVTPQPVFVDSAPSAQVSVTARSVAHNSVLGSSPIAGVPVELLSAVPTEPRAQVPTPTPTGGTATTGADGVARIAIPGPAVPFRYLAAQTRPTAQSVVSIPTSVVTYMPSYAHMTATATRLADGRLQISGTISPALPGRKVRLDRKLDRICNASAVTPGRTTSPSQATAPAGCFERYTQDPVATADVSADGATYTVVAPSSAAAGTYRVALDFANGALVFPGESAPFDAA
jgi:hypothetical protein